LNSLTSDMMKVEIILGHKVFGGRRTIQIFDFPVAPAVGDLIDLKGWTNPDDFEEEESFIFECNNVVKERYWCRYKGDVILQLWIDCENEE